MAEMAGERKQTLFRVVGERNGRLVTLDPPSPHRPWSEEEMRPYRTAGVYKNVRIQSQEVIETNWVDLPENPDAS